MQQLSFLTDSAPQSTPPTPTPTLNPDSSPAATEGDRRSPNPEPAADPNAPDIAPSPSLEDPSQPPPHRHPLAWGTLVPSPGAHFNYRIIGPCCRLFDREELPWPCCRLQWRGKEPSWRRIGRRLVPDLSVKQSPSYAVQILEASGGGEPVVMTFYQEKLPRDLQTWWYARRTGASP
ncbi:hypothetical protein [Prochlorothrix hollandica]|uniref:hypothetical protein n=1 Tax=Prochlorothrix hollandica TaxID=1223 RepID=UPI00034882FF|nr:hypothetical protein [Prochlorothrix hollandica]